MDSLYQLPFDIRSEFTIDGEGRVWATAAGTARLAGVDHKSLTKPKYGVLSKLKNLINNSEGTEELPKCLKPFAGFNYWLDRKIPDTLVFAIVSYYAYDSKQGSNSQAQSVALAMGSIGVRTWMQQELGWQGPDSDSNVQGSLNTIMNRLGDIEHQVAVRRAAEAHHAGIADIVEGLATTKLLAPASLPEPFTASQYVRVVHGLELTRPQSTTLGRLACDAFTVINKCKPSRTGKSEARVYWHRDLHAWAVVYESWLAMAK